MKNLFKRTIAILLILAMVIPSLPLSIFAANENENNDTNETFPTGIEDKVNFEVSWMSGNEIEEAFTGAYLTIKHSISFNGVPTGFKNVVFHAETDGKELGIIDKVQGQYNTNNGTRIEYGNQNSGTSITDRTISVQFNNVNERKTRIVKLWVDGTYVDPVTNVETAFKVEKELKADITPATVRTDFDAYIMNPTSPTISSQSTSIIEYGRKVGWYRTNVSVVYPMNIHSNNYTQKLELVVTINRHNKSNESKLSEGYSINWDGLDEVFGQPTEVTNPDGSKTFTFILGNDFDTLDKSNIVAPMNKTYNVVVTYQTPNTDPRIEGTESYTYTHFSAVLNATGFSTEKVYGSDETITKIEKSTNMSNEKGTSLNSYTPGQSSWISTRFSDIGINSNDSQDKAGAINGDVINDLKNNGTIDIEVSNNIRYIIGSVSSGDAEGYIIMERPKLKYYDASGKLKTIILNSNQIYLKSIEESFASGGDSYLVQGSDILEFDGKYDVPSGQKFNEYSTKIVNFLSNSYRGYKYVYTLNKDELGLSDAEIDNIQNISFSLSTSGSQWIEPSEDTINISKVNELVENQYSYFELSADSSLDTTIEKLNKNENKKITLKMTKNNDVFGYDTADEKTYVVNQNPVFFVQLPDGFKYSNFSVSTSPTTNRFIYVDQENIRQIKKNGTKYLVIPCVGTYNSADLTTYSVNVSFTRKLVEANVKADKMYVYMITDNENYYRKSKNTNELEKEEGVAPDYLYERSEIYSITAGGMIGAQTKINYNGKSYLPNPSNSEIEKGEITKPLVVKENETVTIESSVHTTDRAVDKISILSRLPFADNKYMYGENLSVVPDNFSYSADDEFYKSSGSSLKGIEAGVAVPHNTLVNITNLKLYEQKQLATEDLGIEKEINKSKYKIYYSTEADATLENGTFTLYEEGVSDLSQAKNIKVVLNDDYTLKKNYKIIFKYDATMPSDAGLSGALCAINYSYTQNEETKTETLHSPAAFVINGNPNGKVVIQKKFEDYPIGKGPSGVGLANIEFKLQYFDDDSDEKKFLKDSNDQDVVATTNASGIATFTNVPDGEYLLYEVTEFANYSGIGDFNLIEVDNAETVNYTAINKLKRGKIKVSKEWQGAVNYYSPVSFSIKWAKTETAQSFSYSPANIYTTATSNDVVFENVPYGKYTISESGTPSAWVAQSTSKTETLNSELLETTFTNIPSKGTIEIVKTVPSGETVDGLKFHIVGNGTLSWYNAQGNLVTTDSETTIKIGDAYPSNVTVVKSNNDTTATITLSNMDMGSYQIEEIEVPVLDGTTIEKYAKVSSSTSLNYNNQKATVNLKNDYKYGQIEIKKKAKLKDGNEYLDIGDLSGVKVKVAGTSYYGNEIEATIELDENGHGIGKFEIGKYTITEVVEDGYTAYYGEDASAPTTPPEVTVSYNKKTTQNIYNEHTGKGYVRVEKSLEGVTNPQTVIDAGIQFRIVGQNVAGGRVNETININKIDAAKNVAYGISNAISTGGDYELQEVEATVPEFFETVEPKQIEIKTSNTENDPLVIKAINKRSKGNLEMITTTEPKGGPLTGITYKVTEVKVNKNGTYQTIGTPVSVDGSNNDVNPSFAELKEINSGYYLVEQDKVPAGWIKDSKQIVEVPSYNTGYANFEITAQKELPKNKVTINKIILNEENEVATNQQIAAANLNANESFEVKITNVNTQENYYVFTSKDHPGVIQGLEEGTYAIEEVFKPKYTTEGYYKNIEVEPSIPEGAQGEIETQIAEQRINASEGKYLFTITDNGSGIEDVDLTVKNKINTKYGFGGQTSIDNLSKTLVAEEEVTFVTKAVIYVVDEENNAISGAVFTLFDSEGNAVTINDVGTEVEIKNKKLIIKGLPVGGYTLKCISYPEGYLKPEDKEIIVYSDATQVSRVEIQKDIPRGSLTLSTVYTNDKGDTKYTSRSKYKVVDKATGELVKFVRTSTGDYKKSNLDDASPIITLKSGPVEVEGIETGNYEVGIVDVTSGYGIIKDTPEDVSIEKDTNKEVSVEVINQGIVQVDAGQNTTMYLNKSGELYIVGYGDYYIYGDGIQQKYSSQFTKIRFPIDDVKITKFTNDYYGVVALDTEGRVWAWGRNDDGKLANGSYSSYASKPTLIRDGFKDIASSEYQTLLLDDSGAVWTLGCISCDGTGTQNYSLTQPITSLLMQNVKIEKLAKLKSGSSGSSVGLIDTEGKVWTWGNYGQTVGNDSTSSVYEPICISNTTSLNGVVVKDLLMTQYYAMALDNDGNIWLWGTAEQVCSGVIGGISNVPVKVPSSYFGNAKIKSISGMSETTTTGVAAVIDEYGKVWTWGYGEHGELGNGKTENSTIPTCISDDEDEMLYGLEIKDIDVSEWENGRHSSNYYHVVAVDKQNQLWSWGGDSSYSENGPYIGSTITTPREITNSYNAHLEYNLKFEKIFEEKGGYRDNYFAIDSEGKVWVWGNNNSNALGIWNYTQSVTMPMVLDIPGAPKMKKVDSYESLTIMLSEDGRVFIAGEPELKGDGTVVSSSGFHSITEITNNFNLPTDVKIVDVYTTDDTYIAIDSDGKVYTWGTGSYTSIGRTDMENAAKIECISDDENEVLYGVKIKKMTYHYYGDGPLALAENGDVYAWGDTRGYGICSKTPILISAGIKMIDVSNLMMLDEQGRLWRYDYYNNDITCVSDSPQCILSQYYSKDENYRIVDMYNNCKNDETVVLKDSDGNYWEGHYHDLQKVDLKINNIVDIYGELILDADGQIWKRDGSRITDAIKVNNAVYNVKMKHIVSDNYVSDEEGNLYYFNGNNNAKLKGGTYSTSFVEYLEGTKGLTIVDSIRNDYGQSYANEYAGIALDSDGKLWGGSYNGVTCLSEVSGSNLANEYANDNTFKIERIFSIGSGSSMTYYAVDNQGRLWAWGYGAKYACCNGSVLVNVTAPLIAKDRDDNTLNNITEIIPNSTTTPTTFIAKNSDGQVWVWGQNTRNLGLIGTSYTNPISKPMLLNSTKLENKQVKDIMLATNHGILVCTDGSVYVSNDSTITGSSDWKLVGTCEGAEKVFVKYAGGSTSYPVYFVSGNGKTWAFGRNYTSYGRGLCGQGDSTTRYVRVPTLVSDQFEIKNVLSQSTGSYKMNIQDQSGNIWTWGGTYNIPVTRPEMKDAYNAVALVNNNTNPQFLSINTGIISTAGKIYDTTNDNEVADNSDAIIKLYGELNNENITKFAKLLNSLGKVTNKTILLDGKCWSVSTNESGTIPYMTSYTCLNDVEGSEMAGKEIISASQYKAIDTDGNLYVWGLDTGLYDNVSVPTCTTNIKIYQESSMKSNNMVTNYSEPNELYNVKMKDLVNDKFAIDENDNVWYFNVSGEAVNLSNEVRGDENPLLNKEIIETIGADYVVTSDNELWYISGNYPVKVLKLMDEECEYITKSFNPGYEYYVALDKNGKIWTCGVDTYGRLGNGAYTTNKVPVCLNDIPGTALNDAQNNNPNYRINKVTTSSGGFYALDSEGKLWYWGRYSQRENKLSPICLTDIEGSELYDAYYNNNIKIVELGGNAIDSEGVDWIDASSGSQTAVWQRTNRADFDNIHYDQEAGVYKNANGDIMILKGATWTQTDSNNIEGIHRDEENKVYRDGEGGLVKLDGTTWRRFADMHNGGDLSSDACVVKAIELPMEYHRNQYYMVLTKDGNLYKPMENGYDLFATCSSTRCRELYNVTDIDFAYEITGSSKYNNYGGYRYSYAYYYVVETDHGTYHLEVHSVDYNTIDDVGVANSPWCIKINESGVLKKDVIGTPSKYSSMNILTEDGNLYAYGYQQSTTIVYRWDNTANDFLYNACYTTTEGSPFYNMKIVEMDKISNRYFITNDQGDMYTWKGGNYSSQMDAPIPELCSKYDDALIELYGEVNNDIRKQFFTSPMSTTSGGLFLKNGQVYKVRLVGSEIEITNYSQQKYLNGIGNITSVVGEREIQAEDGTIYQVVATGTDTYELQKVDAATPFETADPDETVDLPGINVVKQTKHKALDDQGKLYVWDEYTGLVEDTTGVVCLTEVEYQVEPVYSTSNGWSVVKSSF